jgi:hypothetical protein
MGISASRNCEKKSKDRKGQKERERIPSKISSVSTNHDKGLQQKEFHRLEKEK